MPRIVLALLLTCLATAATAQSIGEPLPGRAAPRDSFSKAAPATGRGVRPCPEYGAGYVRLEGSSFCVRAGGSVRAEVGKTSGRGYGSRTDGVVYLESRGQSSFGPVRSVLSVRGQVDRGLDSGPYYRY